MAPAEDEVDAIANWREKADPGLGKVDVGLSETAPACNDGIPPSCSSSHEEDGRTTPSGFDSAFGTGLFILQREVILFCFFCLPLDRRLVRTPFVRLFLPAWLSSSLTSVEEQLDGISDREEERNSSGSLGNCTAGLLSSSDIPSSRGSESHHWQNGCSDVDPDK